MEQDGIGIVAAAKATMMALSHLCGRLHRTVPREFHSEDYGDFVLVGIYDESKLYKMRVDGEDNGWSLDLKVRAKVKWLDRYGKEYGRTLTLYRIADRLEDEETPGRLFVILHDDLTADEGALAHQIVSQFEIEMAKMFNDED